jgi:hypothetical protein
MNHGYRRTCLIAHLFAWALLYFGFNRTRRFKQYSARYSYMILFMRKQIKNCLYKQFLRFKKYFFSLFKRKKNKPNEIFYKKTYKWMNYVLTDQTISIKTKKIMCIQNNEMDITLEKFYSVKLHLCMQFIHYTINYRKCGVR